MDYFQNRSWMYRRTKGPQIGASEEFIAGVKTFLNFAYSHQSHVVDNQIRCPCTKCKVKKYEVREVVEYHLIKKGFMSNYDDFWWAHGQVRIPLAAQVRNEDISVYRMNEMVYDASANRASGTPPGQRAMGTYRGGTKSQVQYMKEAQTQSEGGTQTNWTDPHQSLRTNLPGADVVSEQYGHLMAEKYPDASSRPAFDQNLWVTASGGAKKGYVKGLSFKRSRPSNFTTCTSASSSVDGSTATSAAPTSQQSAEEMVRAICHDQNLMDMLSEALLSRMSTDQIRRHLVARAQSQGSADTQPPPPPPGTEGN